MAYGSHWEWRGFGSVSSRFAEYYYQLEVVYDRHKMEDCYLYVPGLEANIKLRSGAENGLKFKWLNKTENNFEVWTENEDELFNFPLNNAGRDTLLNILERTALDIPKFPNNQLNREAILHWLRKAGITFVEVSKERESRKWVSDGGIVLVEWTKISKPQNIISIGLENYSSAENELMTKKKHKELLKNAIGELELTKEAMQPMNYMEAVKIWAHGNKI